MWSREKENSSVRGTRWGGRLPGEGCMNDYFDVDLFYGHRLKATLKWLFPYKGPSVYDCIWHERNVYQGSKG